MNVSEVQKALGLLVAILNKAATKAVDCSAQEGDKAPDGKPFEFIGFQARSMAAVANQATVEEQINTLVEKFQLAMQDKFHGPTIIYWREYPGVLLTPNGVRIGCRVRFAATIAMVKNAELVVN